MRISRPIRPGTELTLRQELVFREILAAVASGDANRLTFVELSKRLGVSSTGVICHLEALRKKGWIRRGHSRACAIEVIGLVIEVWGDDSEQGQRLAALLEGVKPC